MKFSNFFFDERAASLAEFALVTPVFFGLVFFVIHMGIVLYATTTLHWASEVAARCAAINVPLGKNANTSCVGATNIQAYAVSKYQGPNVGAQFTYTQGGTDNAACQYQVVGSGTYNVNVVVTSVPISLNSKACYPNLG